MTLFEQTVQDYAGAITALDADAFVSCFAADCELNDPVGAPTLHGQDAVRAFFNGFASLLSQMAVRHGKVYECGSRVAFSWTMEAVGKNGQATTTDGIDIFEFNEAGKIVRSFGYWNPGPFVADLTK